MRCLQVLKSLRPSQGQASEPQVVTTISCGFKPGFRIRRVYGINSWPIGMAGTLFLFVIYGAILVGFRLFVWKRTDHILTHSWAFIFSFRVWFTFSYPCRCLLSHLFFFISDLLWVLWTKEIHRFQESSPIRHIEDRPFGTIIRVGSAVIWINRTSTHVFKINGEICGVHSHFAKLAANVSADTRAWF